MISKKLVLTKEEVAESTFMRLVAGTATEEGNKSTERMIFTKLGKELGKPFFNVFTREFE